MQRRFPMSRKLILLLGDIALMVFAAVLASNILLEQEILQMNIEVYTGAVPVMVILMGVLFNINGLFSLEHKRYAEILLSLAVALFNLFIIMMAISFFIQEFSYSRGVLILTVAFQFLFIATWKYLFWRLERSLHAGIRKVL